MSAKEIKIKVHNPEQLKYLICPSSLCIKIVSGIYYDVMASIKGRVVVYV